MAGLEIPGYHPPSIEEQLIAALSQLILLTDLHLQFTCRVAAGQDPVEVINDMKLTVKGVNLDADEDVGPAAQG